MNTRNTSMMIKKRRMNDMLVNFGAGKCPVCGDFGTAVQKDIFHCGRCRVSFNEFYVSTQREVEIASKDCN
jgi:hypothetical protein